jgi:hypothetical protein
MGRVMEEARMSGCSSAAIRKGGALGGEIFIICGVIRIEKWVVEGRLQRFGACPGARAIT